MNTWSLSFLLLLVVACGLLFQVRELFEDLAESSELMFDAEQVELRHAPSRHKPKHMPLTYSHDINIARELNTRPDMIEGFVNLSDRKSAEGFCNCAGRVEGFADSAVGESRHKCPVCPDMSKYIRLDEVPCWNCSLP